MIELESLKFKGFGRFVEEQQIDFTKLGNLIQVDAENRNTKGSSGAGKSTVFNVLDYLLGLNDLSNNVLQSRLTKEHMQAEGLFKKDGKPLRIVRGKKLLIEFEGKVVTGSSELTEAELDKILGMPRALFRPMLHKRQKEGGFFLKFTPSQTNDFLCLGLDLQEHKKKLEIPEARIKVLSDKFSLLSGTLNRNKTGLQASQDALLSLGLAPIRDMHPEVVKQLQEKSEVSWKAYKDVEAAHSLERSLVENSRPEVSVIPYDRTKIDAFEKGLKIIYEKRGLLERVEQDRQRQVSQKLFDLKTAANGLQRQIADADKAKLEAPGVALEIKKLRENMCPTCEQGWITDKAKEREAQLLAKIGLLKETISVGAKASETLVSTLLDLQNLQGEFVAKTPDGYVELKQKETELNSLLVNERLTEQSYNKTQNESNKVTLDAFSFQQAQMRLRHMKELEQYAGQFNVDDKAMAAASLKLRAYDEAKNRYDSTLATLKRQEETYQKEVEKLSGEIALIEAELPLAEESRRCIKSYISCKFDDALVTIGDTATRIARSIPNMANATIQLEGIKETKDGKVKEEVNAVIHVDGEEGIPIKSLSGGERSAVDLAIDLAVIDYLESKTNKGINIFILDEPFTGLDTVSIEMALEVLKNSNISKKLIIVDHNPEVKQMVQSRLVVVRDGTTSTINL